MRDSICNPFHTLHYQEGLEVAVGSLFSRYFLLESLAVLSPAVCHFMDRGNVGRLLVEVQGVVFLELQHQQSRSDSLKLCQAAPEELYEKYFLRCLFLKYLSKKGGECSD